MKTHIFWMILYGLNLSEIYGKDLAVLYRQHAATWSSLWVDYKKVIYIMHDLGLL